MIDAITGKRVFAQIDDKLCVYAAVYSSQDAERLEAKLDEYWIPWDSYHKESISAHGGRRIRFGIFANAKKVQLFLDEIDF